MTPRFLSLFAASTLTILLSACGGGSGGGAGGPAPAAQMGSVTLSLSDGIIQDYDQVLMEIAEIRFISDHGQDILVLDQPTTVDFLALQNFSEVLLHREVVSGTYSKIRLILNSLTLVKLDANGNVASQDSIALNGLRKVDINPRGPFQVRGGQDLVIDIEIDLDKSIHVVGAGNSGKIQFRPVIFASINTEDAFNKLYRVEGTVDSVDGTAGTFKVCDIRRAFTDGVQRPQPADVCVNVAPNGGTHYFDQQANPDGAGFGGIAPNDPVVIYGKFDLNATPDRLVPAVVATGQSFDRPMGVAASEYRPATDDFDLGGATDQCTVDPNALRVEVAPGAPAFVESATGADEVDIAARSILCLRAETEGYTDTSVPSDPFLRAFIVLLGESVAGRLEFAGVLADKTDTPATNDFVLDLDASTTNEVVVVGAATRLVKITYDAGGQVVTTEELTAVPVGVAVTVYGVRRTDGSNIVDASFILQEVHP